MSKINEMRLGFETAYIDGSVVSSSTYRPQFVSNNHKEGKKVLSSIEDELLSCDGFQISVACNRNMCNCISYNYIMLDYWKMYR